MQLPVNQAMCKLVIRATSAFYVLCTSLTRAFQQLRCANKNSRLTHAHARLYALEGGRGGGRLLMWDFQQPDEPVGISAPYHAGEAAPLSLAVNTRTKLVAVGAESGGFTLMDSRCLVLLVRVRLVKVALESMKYLACIYIYIYICIYI
jgi:hypothetical protein